MTPTPTPTQIQQVIQAMPAEVVMAVIEHLDSLGYIVCKKEPVGEVVDAALCYDGYSAIIDTGDVCMPLGTKLYSAAPAYAMRNAAEKGGE